MTKKTFVISILVIILAGVILGSFYFFWWQKKKDCFWKTNVEAQRACEDLRTLEDKGTQCVAENDLNCLDLLNYKFFYYLLARKEKNDITDKICREVLLAPKNDIPPLNIVNQDSFCADVSRALLERNEQSCDLLFNDDYGKKTCKFFITGDLQYCGDSRKCQDRAILIKAFLNRDFSTCDQIEEFNARTACVFFQRFEENEVFTCDSIYTSKEEFFGRGLDKIYCRNAAN